jgi:hypothetical protein
LKRCDRFGQHLTVRVVARRGEIGLRARQRELDRPPSGQRSALLRPSARDVAPTGAPLPIVEIQRLCFRIHAPLTERLPVFYRHV